MTRLIDGEQEVKQQLEPLEAPEINQNSLLKAMAEARDDRRGSTDLKEARDRIQNGAGMDEQLTAQVPDNIKSMMKLFEPSLRVKGAEGTKKQKISYISYWTTFCAAYNIAANQFGSELSGSAELQKYKVKEELATLAAFAGYVIMYPRIKGKSQNSVALAESTLGVIRN